MSELNLFSLLWRRDTQSLQELLDCYELTSSDRSLLISIRCLRENCTCALNNQEVLMLKAVRDSKLVSGSWSKLKATAAAQLSGRSGGSGASPANGADNKSIKVILTDYSTGWFEVLNENGASIPYWSSVRDVARHKPQSIFLRKDQKCLFARNKSGNGSLDLSADSTGILKAGTVLSYVESGKFRVQKHRKVKELPLVKCSDSNGHLVFLGMEDKCAVSPVAGAENISGVHTLQSLLSKFQFPISVRPVLGAPLPWLTFSDRHSLRLVTCSRGDLLFLASLSNPERFFVVTPEMLQHHAFRVGESELQHHTQLLERHSSRVTQFLQSYHPYEALRYLMRHLSDATNQLAPQERNYSTSQGDQQQQQHLHQRQSSQQHLRGVGGVGGPSSSEPTENDDDLLDEVEDIYFYVRTGRMPQKQQQFHSKSNSSNDSGLVLGSNPQSRAPRQPECFGVPAAPRPFRATSCEDLLDGRQHHLQQHQQHHQHQQQQQHHKLQQQRHPPPPLPPRKYFGNGNGINNSPTSAVRQQSAQQQRGYNGNNNFDVLDGAFAAAAAAMATSNGGGAAGGGSGNFHGSRGSMHAQMYAAAAASAAAASSSRSGSGGGFL